MSIRMLRSCAGALLIVLAGPARALESYVPADDRQVLERVAPRARAGDTAGASVPGSAAQPSDAAAGEAALRSLRAELARDPANAALAARLAAHAIALGRAHADPRYFGQAQAALAPWWTQPAPPPEVRLLRATLRQQRHEFAEALEDLDALLAADSGQVQARLTRAVVRMVRGEPRAALADCARLLRTAPPLVAGACAAAAQGLSGQGAAALAALETLLQQVPDAAPPERLWAHTVAAEIAERLGRDGQAESHFRAALALPESAFDPYLRTAYADFLLRHQQAGEVAAVLAPIARADAALLRSALAARALADPAAGTQAAALALRFAQAQERGEALHGREESRFALHLGGEPERALALAQANWSVQREPDDALVLLEAALACGDAAAVQQLRDWLRDSGLEDVRLQALLARAETA